MIPQPKAINDDCLVYNPILFFFSQIYSDVVKIHLFEPICIVKDLLREREENFQNLVRKLAWTV